MADEQNSTAFCVEAAREILRRALEGNNMVQALRALRILMELGKRQNAGKVAPEADDHGIDLPLLHIG
jgi:hypothetical protein